MSSEPKNHIIAVVTGERGGLTCIRNVSPDRAEATFLEFACRADVIRCTWIMVAHTVATVVRDRKYPGRIRSDEYNQAIARMSRIDDMSDPTIHSILGETVNATVTINEAVTDLANGWRDRVSNMIGALENEFRAMGRAGPSMVLSVDPALFDELAHGSTIGDDADGPYVALGAMSTMMVRPHPDRDSGTHLPDGSLASLQSASGIPTDSQLARLQKTAEGVRSCGAWSTTVSWLWRCTDSKAISDSEVAHISANSPEVTMALVRRIRDLCAEITAMRDRLDGLIGTR